MPKSNYSSSMRGDVEKAYNKSMGGQGGAKKPKPMKMKAGGKKSPTGSATVGGGS